MFEYWIILMINLVCFLFAGFFGNATKYPKGKPFGVSFSEDMSSHPKIKPLIKFAKNFSMGLCILFGVIPFFLYFSFGGDLVFRFHMLYFGIAFLIWQIASQLTYSICHKKVKELKREMVCELEGTEKEEVLIPQIEEDNWKWGLFYFNPQDPAVLVDEPVGIGVAFNWARSKAWLFLIASQIVLIFWIVLAI